MYEVGSTGPYQASQFARKLWLENENLADDRFKRDDADEDEKLSILVGKDQQYEILFNEPAEISPCGLTAFNSHLGKVVSGPKKEDSSKQGQTVVSQLILNSNHSIPQISSSFFIKTIQTSKSERRETSNPILEEKGVAGNNVNYSETEKDKKDNDLKQINFDLSLFWNLENLANLNDCNVVESNDRFNSFEKDITRQSDGRYCTPIPWAIDKWRLEKNYQMASGRLQSMLNRLRKSPEDLANYTKEIEQLKNNKFVEEADIDYNGLHITIYHITRSTEKTKRRPRSDQCLTVLPKRNTVRASTTSWKPGQISIRIFSRCYYASGYTKSPGLQISRKPS